MATTSIESTMVAELTISTSLFSLDVWRTCVGKARKGHNEDTIPTPPVLLLVAELTISTSLFSFDVW